MKPIKNFRSFITEEEVKKDKELKKYVDDNYEICPRCKEHINDCECEESDYWSTETYHRIPKGKEIKNKPKQEFKK